MADKTSKTVTDQEAYDRWWNAQTLLGDPARRLWLSREAFFAGMTAARAQVETKAREDGQHCNCWYDGEACCACGDPPQPEPPVWCKGCGYHVEGGLCGYDTPCVKP